MSVWFSYRSARFLTICAYCTVDYCLYCTSENINLSAINSIACDYRYGMWTGNIKHSRFSSFFVSVYSSRQLFDQIMEKSRAEESERLRRAAKIAPGGFGFLLRKLHTFSGSVCLSWGQLSDSCLIFMLIEFDNSTYHTQMFLERKYGARSLSDGKNEIL